MRILSLWGLALSVVVGVALLAPNTLSLRPQCCHKASAPSCCAAAVADEGSALEHTPECCRSVTVQVKTETITPETIKRPVELHAPSVAMLPLEDDTWPGSLLLNTVVPTYDRPPLLHLHSRLNI